MIYARPQDVRRKLRFTGEEFTDVDLQDELEEANRKIPRNFRERIKVMDYEEEEEKKTWNLTFSPILEVDKVLKNTSGGRETIDSDNYSLNSEEGSITFDSSFDRGIVLLISYIPEIYKDLEVLYACESILTMNLVTTSDELIGQKTEKIREKISQLKNRIKTKGGPIAVADHRPHRRRGMPGV